MSRKRPCLAPGGLGFTQKAREDGSKAVYTAGLEPTAWGTVDNALTNHAVSGQDHPIRSSIRACMTIGDWSNTAP